MEPKQNITKTTPPRLPGILSRPKLTERLKQNADKKLILILGQAAQGKSTLCASHVKTMGMPFVWGNLSKRESDPANLFYLLVTCLQQGLKGVNLEPLLTYPSINTGSRPEIPMYREWIDAVCERVRGPVQIVLDGLDRLQTDAPSFRFLQLLIKESSPDLHLFVISREEPPLQIQDLKIKQQAFVISNEDLAFSFAETKSFFQDCRGIALRSDQIRSIHQMTEGWVGGLVLLSEILLRMPEHSREIYMAGEVPGKFKGEVFRYFAEEILSSEPEEMRNLLIVSSILKTIEPVFLQHYTGTENARVLLQELAAKNLFVTSVYDSKKGWTYRFHPLFREFLREKFEEDLNEQRKHALFFRAGELYEKGGDPEQAMDFYLECHAYDSAASSLEHIGVSLWRSGRTSDLARRLRALPEDLVLHRPWLLFYLSLARRCTDVEENISTLKDAFDLFERADNPRGQMVSLALLIETTLARGSDSVPMKALIEKAESLLGAMNDNTAYREKAYLWCELGIAYSMRGGDPQGGVRACINAESEAKRVGDKVLLLNAIVGELIGVIYLGDFSRAHALSKTGIRLARETGIRELELLLTKEMSEIALFQGNFHEAAERVAFLREAVERYGLQYLSATAHYSEIRLNIYTEDYARAADIGRSLWNFSRATGNRFGEAMYFLLMGVSSYRQGDFQEGRHFTSLALDRFSAEQTYSEFHIHWGKLMMGLLCYQLGDNHETGERLLEALKYFSKIESHIFTAECHLALALWAWSRSHADECASHLKAAFRIAEEKGYNRFITLSDKDLARACTLTLELQTVEAETYAGHLLAKHLADPAGPELERLKLHKRAAIRKKARPIMKAIYRARAPRIRIRTMGEFRVNRNGAFMAENDWEGGQPKALLKAILARGPQKIPAELIMDDLWPDSNSQVKNLKAALHRLRKSLEPELNSAFGSSYVHLKANRVYLDEELCQVDAYRFLSLIKEGVAEEKKKNERKALSLYKQAVTAYKGDFLTEELYMDRINVMREALSGKYVECLLKLARDCENRRALNKALRYYKKALEADPILETAYQRVMILHDHNGRKNEAMRAYQACKKALSDGLDTVPDDLTTSIYLKIQH